MKDSPFGQDFNKNFYQFLMGPESPPADILRVASLYHGGRVSAVVEDLGLNLVWKHLPSDTGLPGFEKIPPIDLLVATIPDEQRVAISLVMRYLRLRRPWVFLLVREHEAFELLWGMQEETARLGYVVNRSVHDGMSFLVGTLGQDFPAQTGEGENLIGRIIRECGERWAKFGQPPGLAKLVHELPDFFTRQHVERGEGRRHQLGSGNQTGHY